MPHHFPIRAALAVVGALLTGCRSGESPPPVEARSDAGYFLPGSGTWIDGYYVPGEGEWVDGYLVPGSGTRQSGYFIDGAGTWGSGYVVPGEGTWTGEP